MAPTCGMSAPVLHAFDVKVSRASEFTSSLLELLQAHQGRVFDRLEAFLKNEEQLSKQLFEDVAKQLQISSVKHTGVSDLPEDIPTIADGSREAIVTFSHAHHESFPAISYEEAASTSNDSHGHWTTKTSVHSGNSQAFDDNIFEETSWKPHFVRNTICKSQGKSPGNSQGKSQKVISAIDRHKTNSGHDLTSWQEKAHRVVKSRCFDAIILSLIIINSLVIGCDVQLEVTGRSDHMSRSTINIVLTTCNIVFLFELAARLFAYRSRFFCCKDWAWHWFDFILVMWSSVEMLLGLLYLVMGSESSEMGTLGAARILRILRIARLARTVRFVRALRVLLLSIVSTVRTVGFALMLVGLVIYFHAVILTQAVSADFNETDEPELKKHWGSVFQSMLTLFLSISGGVDWRVALDPLLNIYWIYGAILIFYVTIMYFAILNAITGAFCQAAVHSELHDKDLQLHDLIQSKKSQIVQLASVLDKMFANLDADNSGGVDEQEFAANLQHESVQELLELLDLEVEDAYAFFRLLDKDASGMLNLDEFVKGCLQLKGTARSIDLAKALHEIKSTRKQLKMFMRHVTQRLDNLQAEWRKHV